MPTIDTKSQYTKMNVDIGAEVPTTNTFCKMGRVMYHVLCRVMYHVVHVRQLIHSVKLMAGHYEYHAQS